MGGLNKGRVLDHGLRGSVWLEHDNVRVGEVLGSSVKKERGRALDGVMAPGACGRGDGGDAEWEEEEGQHGG